MESIQDRQITDQQKLEYYQKILKRITVDLFTKKITITEFTKNFDEYSMAVEYYRKKLNQPCLFENTSVNDSHADAIELLRIANIYS